MAITFFPTPGMVLMCDYGAGGFVPPEMVKRRRVVIMSPAFEKGHAPIVLVVPISSTPPVLERAVHVRIDPGQYTFLHETAPVWVKADMISHVSFTRLDRIRVLIRPDFERVQAAVIHALGMGHLLAPHPRD